MRERRVWKRPRTLAVAQLLSLLIRFEIAVMDLRASIILAGDEYNRVLVVLLMESFTLSIRV